MIVFIFIQNQTYLFNLRKIQLEIYLQNKIDYVPPVELIPIVLIMEQTKVSNLIYNRGMFSNHSTSELIPGCRSQILKHKKDMIRKKMNQIADDLYRLKYDHEWEQKELKQLMEKGEKITEKVDERRGQVKFGSQKILEEFCQQPVTEVKEMLDLTSIPNKFKESQISGRSTETEFVTTQQDNIQLPELYEEVPKLITTINVSQANTLLKPSSITESQETIKITDSIMIKSVSKMSLKRRNSDIISCKKRLFQHTLQALPQSVINIALFSLMLMLVFILL